MKRQNRPLPPPFELGRRATAQWHRIQAEEFAGTFRGKLDTPQLCRMAVLAEHQGDYFANRLDDDLLDALKQYRQEFGLPPLPILKRRAA